MVHTIKEGHIEVVKCVTPACYWVKCGDCAGSCKVPESIRWKPYSGEYYPSQGVKVFVHDTNGFFYRGSICGQRGGQSPSRKYVVQLVDTLQIKDFDRGDIYPTFGEISVSCEGFHLVSLSNALPSIPPSNFLAPSEAPDEACEEFTKRIQHWDLHNHVVERLLKANVSFRYKHVSTIDGTLFGSLSYLAGDLVDYLTSLKVLVRVTFRFEKVMKILKSPRLFISDDVFPAIVPKFVNTTLNSESTPVQPELKTFRVFEQDLKLHKNLFSQFHIIMLLSELPRPSDPVVQLINQDGLLCMATIVTPKLSYYEILPNTLTSDEKLNKMLMLYDRKRQNPVDQVSETYCTDDILAILPSSSDVSYKSDSDQESICYFSYDFDESVNQFICDGGIMESACSLHPLPEYFQSVQPSIEDALCTLQIEKFDNWQEVCFPSMLNGKNMLIIGAKSHKKMTTSLIWLMAAIERGKSRDKKANSNAPKCVILVSDYKRANDVAATCQRLSYAKLLMSTCSVLTDTQVSQAKEGCDVLISSPNNWCKLTGELQCYDYSSVNHFVFDSLEKMHANYPEELKSIFKSLKEIKSFCEIQTIVLSNVWNSFIVDYIKCIDPPARFVIDIVQAAFCYNLKPTVVFVGDNYLEQLIKIILNDQAHRRLLLCENCSQVEEIKLATNGIDEVVCIDENQDKAEVLKNIESWKSNEKTFLVCSDPLFQKIPSNDVNVLVSWTLSPITWAALVQRFKAISGHKPEDRHDASVYIFSSSEDLDSLLFIKDILNHVKGCGYIGGNLDENIEAATKIKDEQKIKMPICPFVLMFGNCDNRAHCSFRHCTLPTDTITTYDTNQYLKIDLVRINSAFHFSARVIDVAANVTTDFRLNELRSNLLEIENCLSAAYENVIEDGLHTSHQFNVNDIVGLCSSVSGEKILRRGKIVNIEEDINDILIDVLIMDYEEPNQLVRRDDIFQIPKEVALFPPDLTNIYVTGMLPIDFKSDWYHETSCFVSYFIHHLQNNAESKYELLAGIVILTIDRNIIVDSIHWYRQLSSSIVYSSLNKYIVKSGYAASNPNHIDRLSDLVKRRIELVKDDRFGYRQKFPSLTNEVYVSTFLHPGLFHVNFLDEREELKSFEKTLNSRMNNFHRTNLQIVAPKELCAVQIDEQWIRAIVVGIHDKIEEGSDKNKLSNGSRKRTSISVNVLCVDYGNIYIVNSSKLFVLPESFYTIPYFAVECQLVGIKPTEGAEWCESAIKRFTYLTRSRRDGKWIRLHVKFFGVVSVNEEHKYYRHQVSLMPTKTPDGSSLNQELVISGVASWNESTVDLLINRKMNIEAPKSLRHNS